jgi:hypothetical protein
MLTTLFQLRRLDSVKCDGRIRRCTDDISKGRSWPRGWYLPRREEEKPQDASEFPISYLLAEIRSWDILNIKHVVREEIDNMETHLCCLIILRRCINSRYFSPSN